MDTLTVSVRNAMRSQSLQALGEMEAVLALGGCQSQLLPHDLLGGVVRELEIVGAGHHAWQVVVRPHLGAVEGLLDDGERGTERLEAADRESGAAGDKLEEGSLAILVILRHDLEQAPHTLTVHRVSVIRFTALNQHLT